MIFHQQAADFERYLGTNNFACGRRTGNGICSFQEPGVLLIGSKLVIKQVQGKAWPHLIVLELILNASLKPHKKTSCFSCQSKPVLAMIVYVSINRRFWLFNRHSKIQEVQCSHLCLLKMRCLAYFAFAFSCFAASACSAKKAFVSLT